ncbi:MAG: phage portal protein [Pseudomonadota bacterium]
MDKGHVRMLDRLNRLLSAGGAAETKASATSSYGAGMAAVTRPAGPVWTPRDYGSLARAGYERNVIAYRCIRMVAEAASSTGLIVDADGETQSVHPLLSLLQRPNEEEAGVAFLERVFGYLQTSGNAYIEAVTLESQDGFEVRELHVLRPDRVKVRLGKNGWIEGYDYTVGGRTTTLRREPDGFCPVLHLKLFHPTNDHYGLSPLETGLAQIDLHSASLAWNKALLDNAARPSGALVYHGPQGAENLTAEQFDRLKAELSDAYSGPINAGRPLVLDGGLDWKSMSLSPTDMDFQEAKNSAAREIALAFGVPPMLLGIRGDNTYSNYREANLAFWKQTVLPLVKKTAASLSGWLGPRFGGATVRCDVAGVEALSVERDALWTRVSEASFLTDAEKRQMLGLPADASVAGDGRQEGQFSDG